MENQFRFSGKIDIVRTEEEANAAVLELASVGVVGFDMEWHAPRVRGVRPGRTALIQICSSGGYCAIFSMADLGTLPDSLRALLCNRDIKKVSP